MRIPPHRWLLCLTLILNSCEDSWFTSQETLQTDIEQAIAKKDFAQAAKSLHRARQLAKSDSLDIIEYNEAILDIVSGNCETARDRLQTLLTEHNQNHRIPETGSNLDIPQTTHENVFAARLHQALAIALQCPTNQSAQPGTNMPLILEHMYQAYFNGLDTRDQITKLLIDSEPPCAAFVSEAQGFTNNTAETAIEIVAGDIEQQASYVLCPQTGLWFNTHIRAHETLTGTIEMKPLPRSMALDDSSSLPYAQFHIDIFDTAISESGQSQPVASYTQPLPDFIPGAEDYQKLTLNLPAFTANHASNILIHLYPEHFGEGTCRIHIQHTANCDKLDDSATYTNDLKPIIYPLISGIEPRQFLLCPTRPDTFEIEIPASHYTLIGMVPLDSDALQDNAIQMRLINANGQELHSIPDTEGNLPGDHSAYMTIRPTQTQTQESDESSAPIWILVHNAEASSQKYQLIIGDNTQQMPVRYELFRADSSPCLPDDAQTTPTISLDEIQDKKSIQLPPVWICPDTEQTYRPEFSGQTDTLRVHTHAHFLSPDSLHADDVMLQALMQLPDDDRAYLVEDGTPTESPWGKIANMHSESLKKPFTADTRIRISTSKAISGFSIIDFSLPDDKQSDNRSDKSEQDENQKKQNKKEDKSKGNENENQSPDKPSETKATPKGPGTDGQGDESTPDPNASGHKAAKYDPTAYERDHINALLDALEQGDKYVPLSGSIDSQSSDKDW